MNSPNLAKTHKKMRLPRCHGVGTSPSDHFAEVMRYLLLFPQQIGHQRTGIGLRAREGFQLVKIHYTPTSRKL